MFFFVNALNSKLFLRSHSLIDLVWFYGISTFAGYLMPNPLYVYIFIKYIYDLWIHFVNNILKWAWALFLQTVKWFWVLLYNNHNLASVICVHIVCSIWPIERTLSSATTPGLNGRGSNGNEGVLHILQISYAGVSLSDGLLSYPELSLGGGVLFLSRYVVSIFYSPSWLGCF